MDPIQTPVPETGPSAWETISTAVSNAACWTGQKIHAAGSYIYELCANIIEWATPFFQSVVKWIVETWDSSIEFLSQNKEVSVVVGLVGLAGIALGILFSNLCSSSDAHQDQLQAVSSAT